MKVGTAPPSFHEQPVAVLSAEVRWPGVRSLLFLNRPWSALTAQLPCLMQIGPGKLMMFPTHGAR